MLQTRHTVLTAFLATLLLAGGMFRSVETAAQDAPATPPTASEAAGPEIVIHPSGGVDGDYFTLEAEPGSSHGLDIILGNADDEPLTLRTFTNDAVPITNGGFAMADEASPPTGPATWLDYPAETFEVAAGEGVSRHFSVTVPGDAAPGQYIAGIALQTAEPLAVEGSEMFKQIIRKAIAVFIIVPGPEEPAFSIGEPGVSSSATGRHQVLLPVVNSGNVLVKPQGELRLVNEAGVAAVTVPVVMGSVYAGTTVPLSVTVPADIPEGDYTVQVELHDPVTGVAASMQPIVLHFARQSPAERAMTLTGSISALPDAADPAFVEVALTVDNAGEPVSQAVVVLDVARDGSPVETYALASSVSLTSGVTELTERYIPAGGWEAGLWTFTVQVQVVDPRTGAQSTAAILDTLPPLEIGG